MILGDSLSAILRGLLTHAGLDIVQYSMVWYTIVYHSIVQYSIVFIHPVINGACGVAPRHSGLAPKAELVPVRWLRRQAGLIKWLRRQDWPRLIGSLLRRVEGLVDTLQICMYVFVYIYIYTHTYIYIYICILYIYIYYRERETHTLFLYIHI